MNDIELCSINPNKEVEVLINFAASKFVRRPGGRLKLERFEPFEPPEFRYSPYSVWHTGEYYGMYYDLLIWQSIRSISVLPINDRPAH